MILPSAWIPTASPSSYKSEKSVDTFPSPSKVMSRLPSELYRASAKLTPPQVPAATILLLESMTRS
jgi:hypothetical protein